MRRALLLSLMVLAGCKTVEVKPEAPPPVLNSEELQVTSQTLTNASLRYVGSITAQEPGTSLVSADFELVVDGAVVAKGSHPLNLQLEEGKPSTFDFDETRAYVKSADELKALDSKGGSLLTALRGTLKLKTPTRSLEVPFARSREVRVPRLPHAKFQEFEAGRYSEDEAGITFHIGVNNTNPFEIKTDSMTYKVEIAGKQVADGVVGKSEKINGSSTGVFDIEAKVNKDTHGAAEVKKLIKSRQLPYVISGQLKAELYEETFEFKGTINLPPSK